MINKLIIDGAQVELGEEDKIPYTYTFSTAKTHTVKFALDGTNEISAEAFKNCANLTKINFPPQIKMIKRRAFENCTRLNNLVIPSTIEYIGANVFDGCTALEEIKFETPTPPDNFCEFPSNTTCFIPNDSKYKLAETLDPDNVQYYSKTWYNQYNEVIGKNLDLSGNTEYYYDAWTSIAPNYQTVEEKNRRPVETIEFVSDFRITDPETKQIVISYTITPADATNQSIYFKSSIGGIVAKVVEDFSVPGEIIVDLGDTAGSEDIIAYAESGAWAKSKITLAI
jgi:hypothetical protein